ncbi:MAG: AMP-binding protein [Bacteroidota bacterium]
MNLHIHDRIIPKDDLIEWATKANNESQPEHIRDIALSILEWYDDKETISLFTSGSTGLPKQIKHSKKSMRASAEKTIAYFDVSPGSTALLCMPVRYIAGKMMLIRSLVGDLDLVCRRPSSHPMDDIDIKIDFAAMTPMQMMGVLEPKSHIDRLDKVILGGGPVSDDLQERLAGLPIHVWQTYGMTETITHIAARKLNDQKHVQAYEALPGVFFATSHDRLVIHADHLDESPIVTTDVVSLLDETHFLWKGRADHVINSGGVKLHPELIEPKIARVLDQRFYLKGEPDPSLGERLVLIIEGEPWPEQEQQRFIQSLRNSMDRYEVPKRLVFREVFDITPTGKVRRT